MGSSEVMPLVTDNNLHVALDTDGMWWAVGSGGSYGGSGSRMRAIEIAQDVSATSFHGKCSVIVHHKHGHVDFVIKETRQKPSSQFFQDDVP